MFFHNSWKALFLLILLCALQLADSLDFRNVNLKSLETGHPQQPVRLSTQEYVNPYGELRELLSNQNPTSLPLSALTNPGSFNFTNEQLRMLGIEPQYIPQTNEENFGLTLGQAIGNNILGAGNPVFNSYANTNQPQGSGDTPTVQTIQDIERQLAEHFSAQTLIPVPDPEELTTAKITMMTTTVAGPTTPFMWTTTKVPAARLSKLSTKNDKKDKNSKIKTAAHISVPSHRLLNDILVIPSSRRLYILAILPIHESSDNKGFDCGRVDVNGFIRLATFLDALNQVNNGRSLKDAGLSLGAVIVDTCTSDLRTVADLYELLSGTNIQKSDLVAIVRDDGSHMPNVDEFSKHLRIPVLNTFFSRRDQTLSTGVLPSMTSPLEAMLDLLLYSQSNCASVVYDELYSDATVRLSELASHRGVCVEQRLKITGGMKSAEAAVRRMLLTEARVVIVLLGEPNWLSLVQAFRKEMVIAGRFILLTVQDPRWQSASVYTNAWPHFDQLLLSVGQKKPLQAMYLHQLAQLFPNFPFPQHWLRQFWSTAFKCHIEGEKVPGEQFSKECTSKQALNLTKIAPDIDVAPVQLAVHAVAYGLRKMVDNVCPGALLTTIADCTNEYQENLFGSILSLEFAHGLVEGGVHFNETSGYRDQQLIINRVTFESQLEFDQLASWDTVGGLQYTSPVQLIMEERDGSRVPLRSVCPKSACSVELSRRSLAGARPTIRDSFESMPLLIFAGGATLSVFVCMMCMYQQLVASRTDSYNICTMFSFGGLSLLCVCTVFFFMPPNAVSCAVRRIAFSIAMSATLAPILVKTLFVWRADFRRHTPLSAMAPEPMVMFWICLAVVVLQSVVSFEWAIFENPTDLSFAVSIDQAPQWRCTPGEDFESKMLRSCFISAAMLLLALICSILSIRHVESRQNVLLCLLSMCFSVVLYVVLPLLKFELRDQVIAGGILVYTYLFIFISYCRKAFTRTDDSEDSTLIMKKKTADSLERAQQQNSATYWIARDQLMSPMNATLQHQQQQQNYHNVHTLPHKMPGEAMMSHGVGTLPHPAPRFSTMDPNGSRRNSFVMTQIPPIPQATLRNPQHQSHYGTHAYESQVPTVTTTMAKQPNTKSNQLPMNLSQPKYGHDNFVEESDRL